MNQHTATVEITRPRTVSNVLRSFSVHIDGQDVGKLKAGETRRYTVPCGERRIEVALDFWRSPPLALTLRPGDTLALECGDQGPRTLSESEDRIFKRPFFFNHGAANTALDACVSVFEGGARLLSCDSAAESRPFRAPAAGYPWSPARFHRSRERSDAADPIGPARRVA